MDFNNFDWDYYTFMVKHRNPTFEFPMFITFNLYKNWLKPKRLRL